MSEHSADQGFLHRALELARGGTGLASPGPLVGAVVVDTNGEIVGTGSYTYSGTKHAEILALEEAGARAGGGTLYINLEPHAHQGRTPPCTDALITAGIRRVVASMQDPNPRVCGRGFDQLRTAGVRVEVGGLEQEARRLNEPFARYVRSAIPLVTLKSAMTLDGKIGLSAEEMEQEDTPRGGWITGDAARAHVQEQRHASDAILVGIGTVLADDPRLTDRSNKARRRPLLRVILDSHLRLPLDSRLVKGAAQASAGQSEVLVFCSSPDQRKKDELRLRNVWVEELPSEHGFLDLHTVIRRLGELEITSLIIEGGSTVNGIALGSGVVDKLFFYYAPKIDGGLHSIPFVANYCSRTLDHPLRLRNIQLHQFGDDIAIEGYFRDPYEK